MKKLILITFLLFTFTNFLVVNAVENKTTCIVDIDNLRRFTTYSTPQSLIQILQAKKICNKNTDKIVSLYAYDENFNGINLEDYTGKENILIYTLGKTDDKLDHRVFLNDKEVFQIYSDRGKKSMYTLSMESSLSRDGKHVLSRFTEFTEPLTFITNNDYAKTGLYIDGVKVFNDRDPNMYNYFLESYNLDFTFNLGDAYKIKDKLTSEEIEKLDNIAKKYDNYSQEKIDKDMDILYDYIRKYKNNLENLSKNELKNFLKINYLYSELKIKELKKMEF